MTVPDQRANLSDKIGAEFRKRQRWHFALVGALWLIAAGTLVSLRSEHRLYLALLLGAGVTCVTADVRVWRCPSCHKSLGRRVSLNDCLPRPVRHSPPHG